MRRSLTPAEIHLEAITLRASMTLERARELLEGGPDEALMPLALIAIAEQLALANALTVVRMARESGES